MKDKWGFAALGGYLIAHAVLDLMGVNYDIRYYGMLLLGMVFWGRVIAEVRNEL